VATGCGRSMMRIALWSDWEARLSMPYECCNFGNWMTVANSPWSTDQEDFMYSD
jgi:hypothetical protein